MTFEFEEGNVSLAAEIKVIGVGGGGGNAINNMIESGLEGVGFIVANTDTQALQASHANAKIQLGTRMTKGLGAGANPNVGHSAALEDADQITEFIGESDMVFVTAGMGGGTGTGAAPVVARLARESGALVIGVVTKPFNFEGKKKMRVAEEGLANLRENVDALITIPNQRLLNTVSKDTTASDAFKKVDDILLQAVRSVSDLINVHGQINLDFQDVKTVMGNTGMALMGTGIASGENRAMEAAQLAIASPLLEDLSIQGARGIIINVTAASELTLFEIDEAASLIQEEAHEDADVIFGVVFDDSLGDNLRITVIATGFDEVKSSVSGVTTGIKGPGLGLAGKYPIGSAFARREGYDRPTFQARQEQPQEQTPEMPAKKPKPFKPVIEDHNTNYDLQFDDIQDLPQMMKKVVGSETEYNGEIDDIEIPTFIRRQLD